MHKKKLLCDIIIVIGVQAGMHAALIDWNIKQHTGRNENKMIAHFRARPAISQESNTSNVTPST